VIDPPSPSPLSALVADPYEDAVGIVSALSYAGFTVTLADSFMGGKRLLDTLRPLVLVTEVRLGAYNGIHLAMRCRTIQPRVTVIVTSRFHDPVLEHEIEAIGATFVPKPCGAEDLLAAIYRTALRVPAADGTLEPVRPPFERRREDRRGTTSGVVSPERRQANRRRGLVGLVIQAASLS
jgi:DNA-binding response OmpR family regulator